MKRERTRRMWPMLAALFFAVCWASAGAAGSNVPSVQQETPGQAQPAPGSASGRVVGVLTDQSGAVIQAGRVEVRAIESNVARSASTDQQGRFAFENLPVGRYRISATSRGFAKSTRDDLVVQAGRDFVADLALLIAREEAAVVVTAPAMISPLSVETDPKAPRQPIPAHDGADYLKTIPGFSIVRKGGTDGDPVLRGMAGSRLSVLLDGQQILGGCGGRMDPPTAYVFPAAYDRITVLKGPQTVLYAAGASAGTVLFERQMTRAARPGVTAASSITVGAFGRHDEMFDVRAAIPSFYIQGGGTRSHTDDYKDGNGAAVHSAYTRWSVNAAFGWTPDEATSLEISVARSDGRAAYADRSMDGSKFARENVAVKFDRRFATSVLQRIEFQSYYNYIDHVMDNFNLRTPGTAYSANNPDRATFGGRAAMTLAVKSSAIFVIGADAQRNVHSARSAMGKLNPEEAVAAYSSATRNEDVRFTQIGLFGEATYALTTASRLVGGVRSDWHDAKDSRACVATSMCPGASPLKNDTLGASDRRTLPGGFARYEHDIDRFGVSGRFSFGVGHIERTPDYWERLKQDPVTLKSAFLSTRPEKTTQIDTGLVWRSSAWSGSVAAFYGRVSDYILIRWKPAPTVTRNVNAATAGGEANVAYSVSRNLKADVTLAYVHADNRTDHKPLAQQPPAEARLGLNYDNRIVSFGALARLAGAQDRVDIGSGNIVSNGQDLGPTRGFAVVSLNGGYRLKKLFLLSAGVDNLLNRTYAEHISQAGSMVPGFVQTMRVNEPGRVIWVKLNVAVR